MDASTASSRPGARARQARGSSSGRSSGPGLPPTTRAAAAMAVVNSRSASARLGATTALTPAATCGLPSRDSGRAPASAAKSPKWPR